MITEITTYNLIKEQIETENRLNEGLIMTHDIYISVDIISDFFEDFKLRTIDVTVNNTIKITTTFLEFKLFTKFLILINNLGYYVSYIYLWKNTELKPQKISSKDFIKYYFDENKLKDINRLDFVLEAKYDISNKLDTNILYHVTENKYLDKVLKIGIKPNSNNTKFDYPDRVYCFFKYEDALNYVNLKKQYFIKPPENSKFKIPEYTIFKITLPLNNNFVFYNDPNYIGKGIYTYNNINKEYLQIIN